MKKSALIASMMSAVIVLALVAHFATTQASPDMAFRPTPTPTGKSIPDSPDGGGIDNNVVDVRGGSIELMGTGVTQDLWSVVQWQGVNDEWHDVDGWRGTFNPENMVKWWVGYEDLGRGSFRWIVYQDDVIIHTSETFQLPANDGEVTRIAFDNSTSTPAEAAAVIQPIASSAGLRMSAARHVDGATNGLIVLQMAASSPVPADLWTQVEWQDYAGVWRNVDGWAGGFNENGQIAWWVAPEHAGTHPFRWVVYESAINKTAVSISPSFALPYASQNIQIDLTN